MSKKKLTDISKIKDEKVVLTNRLTNPNNHPEINFKYLWKCNVCCFNGLSKYYGKHKEEKVFDQLQKFLFEVDQCLNGECLNADVNGALNIFRKSNVVSLVGLYSRGEVDTPVRIRIA